jgi:hypothetical protein
MADKELNSDLLQNDEFDDLFIEEEEEMDIVEGSIKEIPGKKYKRPARFKKRTRTIPEDNEVLFFNDTWDKKYLEITNLFEKIISSSPKD